MRYTLFFLPLCLVLLSGFSTIASAPGPETGGQTPGVSSTASSNSAHASGQALGHGLSDSPLITHSVRLKVVPITYSRPYKQDRQSTPVTPAPEVFKGQTSPHGQALSREQWRVSSSLTNLNPHADRQPYISALRTPLSLQRTLADHGRVASLTAQRLLSLAQRNLTRAQGAQLITV